jgi:site-specific DNA recombinase
LLYGSKLWRNFSSCQATLQPPKALWIGLQDQYDDGGFSGGNLNRPALNRLLKDIEAGKVNVVVVYKIDRLSRSLIDFTKLVEIFDRHGVSFVSVTQSFNTTNSMGRLTLNILLSFAQFERENSAERVRDKVAASRKKGIWMGGFPPLGYDIANRRLLVNKKEANLVQHIFQRFSELGSRMLTLTLLAPDIVDSILDGTQPDMLNISVLKKGFPVGWGDQREFFGLDSHRA